VSGQLFLGGGGDADDERPLLDAFAAAVGTGPLMYWPVALDPAVVDYDSCLHWLRDSLEEYAIEDVRIWNGTAHPSPATALSECAGLFIGGGNTYRLLDVVRRGGVGEAVGAFVDRGGAVYGGSAGAVLLGRDIDTASRIDENEIGMLDTHALDLAAGLSVFCHHEPQDADYVMSWVDAHDHSVMAIPERSGVVVERETVRVVGYEPVLLVTEHGARMLESGDVWAPADLNP
jgi:dipeptidase E